MGEELSGLKDLPEGWRRVRLGEVIEIFDNRRIPLDSEYRSTIKGDFPYCGATGIVDYINDYIFDGEYVLIAEDGGKFNRFEETAYIMNGRFWANNHVHIVRGKDGILDNRFLMHFINYQDITYYILGSTREKLNQKLLKSIVIVLPPLPEQCKIAEILETIDNAIEKTDKIIEKYKRIKQGLMQELLTKGIDENGQIRSEGTHRFKDSPLGRIPEEWEVVELNNKKVIITITDGSHYSPQPVEDSEYYIVNIENLTNGRIELNTCKKISKEDYKNLVANGCKPENNDVLFTKDGTIGISLVFGLNENIVLLSSIAILRPSENLDSYFLKYCLESEHIKKQLDMLTGGSALKRVVLRDIKNFKIPLPPLPEQKRIASILSQIDETIEKEKRYKEKLEKIKQGLMEDLLTGKVRVNHLIEGAENEDQKSNT